MTTYDELLARVEPRPTYDLAARLYEYQRVVDWLRSHQHLPEVLASIYTATLERGGTLWFAGNGGSAADAQHLAAEYVNGMIEKGRAPLDARALTVDTSVLTAIANDRGYSHTFLTQVQAAVRQGDTVVFHSTSGNSPNLVMAADWLARHRDRVAMVALLGPWNTCGFSPLGSITRVSKIHVEAGDPMAVQVGHMMLQHLACEVVEHWAAAGWQR